MAFALPVIDIMGLNERTRPQPDALAVTASRHDERESFVVTDHTLNTRLDGDGDCSAYTSVTNAGYNHSTYQVGDTLSGFIALSAPLGL